LLAGVWAWSKARASLPPTGGEMSLRGLASPATLERDRLGIPIITAAGLGDALRVHGFVHGQDRFFQMDLNRRATGGELAALVGARAVEADERIRRRQRRRAARRLLESLDAASRSLIDAYAEGVNAGLASLGASPPEYLLLRTAPDPWLPEDTLMAALGFFDMLSFNHRMERPLGVLAATLPAELVDFLTPSTSRWDAPLIESGSGGYTPAPIPSPEVVDLREVATVDLGRDFIRPVGMALGSNNWAVEAAETVAGRAIRANDPHLGLRVPHVWHRVQFEIAGRRIVGVGAPGLPGVIIGSNGDVAWGATNSFADQTDLVVIEVDPEDPSRYATEDGWESFDVHPETIEVNGGDSVVFDTRWTRWGPVSDEDWLGRPLVVKTPVHDPRGLDFGLLDMMSARSLEAAAAVAGEWRGPSQNWMLAAADGRIGWVVNGPIPVRNGLSGKFPTSWASGDLEWTGERRGPEILEPTGGKLHTANGRTVPHDERPLTHVWMHSGRSNRIRELLADGGRWDERLLQAIQLDTRSAYHRLSVDVVSEVTTQDDAGSAVGDLSRVVERWNGTAEADQAGFVAVGRIAEELVDRVLTPLLAPAAVADEGFVYDWALADEPVRRLLETRPDHLVPPPHSSWRGFLRTVVEDVAVELAAAPGGLDRTWGEARLVAIRHPLGGLPVLGRHLNMPPIALPGWAGTVRAQTATYGASMRMVVSPGREESGLLHMPTGQSGHFMSPNYGDQHDAWVRGVPTPLLAGEPVTELRFVPMSRR
jgi:penicillin amidase